MKTTSEELQRAFNQEQGNTVPVIYIIVIITVFFFFLSYSIIYPACGILVPQPGVEPGPMAVKVPSTNHWTAREFSYYCFLAGKVN